MTSRHQFGLDFSGKLPPLAQAAKADGMKAADDHADPKWKRWFDDCVMLAAKKKPRIVSDDVLAELEALPNPPDTHTLKAIGSAMVRAVKAGILRPTNEVKRSERPEKHGNRQNVYESRVHVARTSSDPTLR
jgi:hypothetical protein